MTVELLQFLELFALSPFGPSRVPRLVAARFDHG
jgi:hypothetical protein